MESATDVEGMKSSPLLWAGTVLNLMVGMCWIVCLVGWIGWELKFSGWRDFEIDIDALSSVLV